MVSVNKEKWCGVANEPQIRTLNGISLSHERSVDVVRGDLINAEIVTYGHIEIRLVGGGREQGPHI